MLTLVVNSYISISDSICDSVKMIFEIVILLKLFPTTKSHSPGNAPWGAFAWEYTTGPPGVVSVTLVSQSVNIQYV